MDGYSTPNFGVSMDIKYQVPSNPQLTLERRSNNWLKRKLTHEYYIQPYVMYIRITLLSHGPISWR